MGGSAYSLGGIQVRENYDSGHSGGSYVVMEATHRRGIHSTRAALTPKKGTPGAIYELNLAGLKHIFLTHEK